MQCVLNLWGLLEVNKETHITALVNKLSVEVLLKLDKNKLSEIKDKLMAIDEEFLELVKDKIQVIHKLINEDNNLISLVDSDEITKQISYDFDIDFDGVSAFVPPKKYEHPSEFGIGLIVGTSGGGKTTLLNKYGSVQEYDYDNTLSIASNFETYDEAKKAFFGVGLNSIPVWLKPYRVLSNGEKYRATLAKMLKDGAVFDEFTSIVDRPTAKSMASSIGEYIRREDFKNVVFASPHKDIIEWLQPDWVYDLDTNEITLKENLRSRPPIRIDFKFNEKHLWGLFSKHHYISATLNKSANVFTAYWEGVLVGIVAVLTLPSGTLKNAYRGHRTVVFPEYQGFGIGKTISDSIGQLYVDNDRRFFAKTAHPKMGEHRQKSVCWKPTSKNRVKRKQKEATQAKGKWVVILDKPAFSHEFLGGFDINYLKDFTL